jgi:pilus assembly protein CpaB
MNNRALTLSILMAVLAIFFVQSYVSSIEEDARKKFGTEVVVLKAKRDIKEMETINETMLEPQLVPMRFKEPAAVAFENSKEDDKDVRKGIKGLVGSVATVPIKKGEQVTYNMITEPGMRTGLSPQVAPGRRALAIPVTDITGVAKLVKPGDRVDLIAVVDRGGGKDQKLAKTVLQDVVVLSVGRSVTNNVPRTVEMDGTTGRERVRSLAEDSSFNTVTLEVDPAQAQALALVVNNSDNALTLSLRNNDDTDRVNLPSTILDDILGADGARIRGPNGGRR